MGVSHPVIHFDLDVLSLSVLLLKLHSASHAATATTGYDGDGSDVSILLPDFYFSEKFVA